ncbi:protein of unknown function [Pedobacter sp. ok626]|uniref:zinc-dependent metalloprotease n=1 Tax=Pedobacter sp. ok626 TaxID=1761882 RepID=UPI0008913D2C|nr:zinc-dependent metalloprotease [Pedobacter sp. ok626]SDL65880.1 protein of unknown function [Pedobacter sp. ok626]
MKKNLIFRCLLLGFCLLFSQLLKAQPNKRAVLLSYPNFIKTARTERGMFSVHFSDGQYYLEIPATALNKDLIMTSKVKSSSKVVNNYAGALLAVSKVFYFTREEGKLMIRQKEIDSRRQEKGLELAFKRNGIYPVVQQFDILCQSARDSSFVIGIADFMLRNKEFGIDRFETTAKEVSFEAIIGARAFPENVNIECHFGQTSPEPSEQYVVRSIRMLPTQVMPMRFSDPRVNYFSAKFTSYEDTKQVTSREFIQRWNLQPKPEDRERFLAGELIEPAKQIVFYVDDAFPEFWKEPIRKGIEDWRTAFEKIGFKNAIIAKDFPKNDPDFDPEDIRYSTVRYIPDAVENAKGNSVIDPRSGEILQGMVYIYHGVLKMYDGWAFPQLAATVPGVRGKVIDTNLLRRMIRHTATHESGHALGLMHNMAGSSAYPVDSLRSGSFTGKYGISASVMDYARFNYVAQPKDKGVTYMPMKLGPFDEFAIKMGYKPIFDADSPEKDAEMPMKWFQEYADNPLYRNAAQDYTRIPLDPTAQEGDVGDDAVKASRYGIENLKYIVKHFSQWGASRDKAQRSEAEVYGLVLQQYTAYTNMVLANIGGIHLSNLSQNEKDKFYKAVPVKKQREALQFLFTEMVELPKWMSTLKIKDLQIKLLNSLTDRDIFQRITKSGGFTSNPYTPKTYMEDLYEFVWKSALKHKVPDEYERARQYFFVKALLSGNGTVKQLAPEAKRNTNTKLNTNGITQTKSTEFPELDDAKPAREWILQGYQDVAMMDYQVICYSTLKQLSTLLIKAQKRGDKITRNHYEFLYKAIEKIL